MKESQLQNYVQSGILREQINGLGDYRFRRPLNILIPKYVLDSLASVYEENREHGGILEFKPSGVQAVTCVGFINIPNEAKTTYNFEPNANLFNAAVNEVLNSGNLPVVVHTHPTKLGIGNYDSKAVKFYLRSSKPDRAVSRNGIVPFLNLPEAIFVKDERLNGGFGLNFFTGGVFPASVNSLTSLQWVAVAVVFLMPSVIFLAVVLFFAEYARKPKYFLNTDGSLVVKLSI